jgi:hypothetical protein
MLSAKINEWLERNRSRLTRIVLFGGLLGVFLYLAPYVPRDTKIMLDLGKRHADVVELDLTYSLGSDDLRSTKLTYPAGAPRQVRHEVRLPSGDILLAARQTLRDGRTLADTLRFKIPAEADVRISLNKE